MSVETRSTLLYGQLQEGLKDSLMRALAVSGAQSYQELCVAAKNKERRQYDLSRRRLYYKGDVKDPTEKQGRGNQRSPAVDPAKSLSANSGAQLSRRCYISNSPDHLARRCPAKRKESWGYGKSVNTQSGKQGDVKRVISHNTGTGNTAVKDSSQNPMDFLFSSDSEEGDVYTVCVPDRGGKPQSVQVFCRVFPYLV